MARKIARTIKGPIEYRLEGSGPTVVVLNGGHCSRESRLSHEKIGTMGARPAVYTVWVVLSLTTLPMYMFSPKELAPVEDQGLIFGIINNAGERVRGSEEPLWPKRSQQGVSLAPERDLDFPTAHVAVRPIRRGRWVSAASAAWW